MDPLSLSSLYFGVEILRLADMGISSFDVCLVVDDDFVVELGPWLV